MHREMEFRVLEKSKNEIRVEVLNADNTLLRPLVDEMSMDDQVEKVQLIIRHPTLDNPVIYVKVRKGKPQAAFKRAAKKLEKVFEELEKLAEKEIKRVTG